MEDKNNNKSHEFLNDDDLVDFDDDLNLDGLGEPNLPQGESIIDQKNQVSINSKDVGPFLKNPNKFNQLFSLTFQTKDNKPEEENKNPELDGYNNQEPT